MDSRGIVEELTEDHRQVRSLFDGIRSARPGSAERLALVERAGRALVRHATAERVHLYPAVRRFLPDGDGWVERELREHQEIEELLKALEEADPAGEEFAHLLLSLVTRVTEHVVEEEQLLFPRLQALCPADVLRDLGAKVRDIEATAPTRPRPGAPASAPLVRLTAQMWGPLDRIRDAATRRGRR
ncbi:hemerythrin domain-containing protein [Streptomyces carpinensis]|uniref:Hemerythrin domain-containing protein n=1 Tax=Streptomyces carpinensis TaxID=66369 RepID=A0ABV1WFY2_9ACTN|nr:hemerythrin domain-containing protein [Streptomyces carpinensis]